MSATWRTDLPRFAGWWGHDKKERFKMERDLQADAYRRGLAGEQRTGVHHGGASCGPGAVRSRGYGTLRAKSEQADRVTCVPYCRGIQASTETCSTSSPRTTRTTRCQLSILVNGDGRGHLQALTEQGVFCDWREPNVIRMAPVPMYNSFEDVFRFGEIRIKECREHLQ
jgi:kynureninase